MKDHAREKDTAAWLAQEYGGSNSNSLFVVRAGSPEETQLPWLKVQRRIAQLIQEDRFYTEEEQNRFDDIDPIAIREALEERKRDRQRTGGRPGKTGQCPVYPTGDVRCRADRRCRDRADFRSFHFR